MVRISNIHAIIIIIISSSPFDYSSGMVVRDCDFLPVTHGIINVFKGLKILDPDQKWTTAYIIVICILGGIALLLEAITWMIVLRRKSRNTEPNGGSNAI